MIIIVNGMFGTYPEIIAKNLSLQLNIAKSKDLAIEVTEEEVKVSAVKAETDNVEVNIEEQGKYIPEDKFITAEQIDNSTIFEDINDNFLKTWVYDSGIGEETEDPVYKFYGVDYEPEKVIERYKASGLNYYFIAGQIGRQYIDEIKALETDVLVYNIIRNPVAGHTAYMTNVQGDVNDRTLVFDLYNAILLKNTLDVTTYRYEDLLSTKTIRVADRDLSVLNNVNLIDKYFTSEKAKGNTSLISKFNEKYVKIDLFDYLDHDRTREEIAVEYKEYFGQDLPETAKTVLTDLGYSKI